MYKSDINISDVAVSQVFKTNEEGRKKEKVESQMLTKYKKWRDVELRTLKVIGRSHI